MTGYEYKTVFSSIYGRMLDRFGNDKSDIEISFRYYRSSLYSADSYMKIKILLYDKDTPVLADYMYIHAEVIRSTPNIDGVIVDELGKRIKTLRRKYTEGGKQDA